MRVCERENFGLSLSTRLQLRKTRLFWRDHFGLRWFTVWTLALIIYLAVGLQPADAKDYNFAGQLSIPAIGLQSDVAELKLESGGLSTPETIVGSYSKSLNKTLLIGHSTGIFSELHALKVGDFIQLNGEDYRVVSIQNLSKSQINMQKLLKAEEKETLVLMTCAGIVFSNGDATERLIIIAQKS